MKNSEQTSQPEPETPGINSGYWSDKSTVERNKGRFYELGFSLDNLDFYRENLYPNHGLAEPFHEVINIDESVLSSLNVQAQDFAISHEIIHYLISQKLPQDFFNKHSELREKKQELNRRRNAKDEGLPSLIKERSLERLINNYVRKDNKEITFDEAMEILENFTGEFQEFKSQSTDPDYFERAAKSGLNMPIFFDRTEPYKSEDEYESQAVAVLLQLGEKLLKKIQMTEEQKHDLKFGESHFIEEGVCNYLAAKLLDVSLDEIPFGNIDGLATSKTWERKLGGDIKPLIDAIKRGDFSFLQLYKT